MPLGAFKAALMGTAGVSTGDVVLLASTTVSNGASISFSSGITSTYGEYIFRFYNMNPATDNADFTFQVNATDGADYNDSNITSTAFSAELADDNTQQYFRYNTGKDQAQGTSFQVIAAEMGSDADESCAGELHLFNPSSTTYVKQFYSRIHLSHYGGRQWDYYVAGYINDTTAIDDIQFKMSSGNMDGTIKMWGVK